MEINVIIFISGSFSSRALVSVGAVGAAAPTLFLDKGSCTHRFGVGVKKSGYICTHTFEFLTKPLIVEFPEKVYWNGC